MIDPIQQKISLLTDTVDKLTVLVANVLVQREPIDFPIQLSTSMPWNVDYKNRKHLFLWSPIALTLTAEDYGNVNILANTWHQIDFTPGARIFSNQPTLTYAYVKATDEYILDTGSTAVAGLVSISPHATSDGIAGSTISEIVPGIWNGATVDRLSSPFSSGVSNATNGFAGTAPYGFNNTTFDVWRNNVDLGAIINAVAVTTTQTSSAQFNLNGRGVKIVLNVATLTGTTPTLTLHVQGFNSVTSLYYDELVSTAISSTGVTVYTVYPGITATANVSASDIVPRQWQVQVVAGGTITNATYTVQAEVIV